MWRYLWLAVDPLDEGVHDEGVVVEAEAQEPQEGPHEALVGYGPQEELNIRRGSHNLLIQILLWVSKNSQ